MNLTHGGNIYAVAQRMGWDWRDVADFSASINPLGPAPSVVAAIHAAVDRIAHYPEPEPHTLRSHLGRHWNIDPDLLLAGNGATELLHFLARTLNPPSVSLAAPVFSEFHHAFPKADIVPFEAQHWPTDGLVIVTRPANPTGALPTLDTYLSSTTNPLLIDESFIDFTDQPSLLPRLENRPNLYILRSLTKFYALPGLRIGILAGPANTIRQWRSQRDPWQVNVLAEAAVLAAINDTSYAQSTREFVTSERQWLTAQLAAIPGLHPQPSTANYLLIATDQPVAPLLYTALQHKILLRDCSAWPGVPYPHAFRAAVRTRPENERLIAALRGTTSCAA
jgi:threonine-phosphate decarboxylase